VRTAHGVEKKKERGVGRSRLRLWARLGHYGRAAGLHDKRKGQGRLGQNGEEERFRNLGYNLYNFKSRGVFKLKQSFKSFPETKNWNWN
jgi:hypothetical protein